MLHLFLQLLKHHSIGGQEPVHSEGAPTAAFPESDAFGAPKTMPSTGPQPPAGGQQGQGAGGGGGGGLNDLLGLESELANIQAGIQQMDSMSASGGGVPGGAPMNFSTDSMMPPNPAAAFGQPQQQQQQPAQQGFPQMQHTQQQQQQQQQAQQRSHPQAIMTTKPRSQQEAFGAAPFLPPPPAKSGRPQPPGQAGGAFGGMPQQQQTAAPPPMGAMGGLQAPSGGMSMGGGGGGGGFGASAFGSNGRVYVYLSDWIEIFQTSYMFLDAFSSLANNNPQQPQQLGMGVGAPMAAAGGGFESFSGMFSQPPPPPQAQSLQPSHDSAPPKVKVEYSLNGLGSCMLYPDRRRTRSLPSSTTSTLFVVQAQQSRSFRVNPRLTCPRQRRRPPRPRQLRAPTPYPV